MGWSSKYEQFISHDGSMWPTVYLPRFPLECGIFSPDVGKSSNNPYMDPMAGSTISTLLHDKINPKDCQVLSLGDSRFVQFFRVVSGDYGKPRMGMGWSSKYPEVVLQTCLPGTLCSSEEPQGWSPKPKEPETRKSYAPRARLDYTRGWKNYPVV